MPKRLIDYVKEIALGDAFKRIHSNEIEMLLSQFRELVIKCAETFQSAMTEYFHAGQITSEFARLERMTHRYESEADDVRKKLEYTMYASNLIPQSRGDILGLSEALDKLPNQMEEIVQLIYTHNIQIPKRYFEKMEELVKINVAAARETVAVFEEFCCAKKDIAPVVKHIDSLESQSDYVSRDLVCDLFRSDGISDLQKILLSRIIHEISKISNRAEQFGDRIHLVSVKRMF